MPFSGLDAGAIGRSLAQIADRDSDQGEVFFERSEMVELPPEGEGPGIRSRREEGFAVRLVREGFTWMASRDGIAPALFGDALRRVARAVPQAPYPDPPLAIAPDDRPPSAPEVLELPAALNRRLRERRLAFPFRLWVRRHRRQVLVVGTRLAAAPQSEGIYSVEAEMPWGRLGLVAAALDDAALDELTRRLVASFKAREAPPPAPSAGPLLLGPGAAAVLLHEAVAHALETDTLILGGSPEAASGLQLGSSLVSVLDDPSTAPDGVCRDSDDEGMPVIRRWLLREGVVCQPLADRFAASRSPELAPGAARRSDRHAPPVPRSHHLEMPPGATAWSQLVAGADGGLYVGEASRGHLDPLSGELELWFPHARRVAAGELGEPVGGFRWRGRIAEILRAVEAVGDEPRAAGAGWCAKGGQRLAVWATVPALLVGRAEIEP